MLKQKKIDLIIFLFLTKKTFYIIYRKIKKNLKKFGLRTWCTFRLSSRFIKLYLQSTNSKLKKYYQLLIGSGSE